MTVSRDLRLISACAALQVIIVTAMLMPGGWAFTSSWPLAIVLIVSTLLCALIAIPAARWAFIVLVAGALIVGLASTVDPSTDVRVVLCGWAIQVFILLAPTRRRRLRFDGDLVDLDDIPDEHLEALLTPDRQRFSRDTVPARSRERSGARQNGSMRR